MKTQAVFCSLCAVVALSGCSNSEAVKDKAPNEPSLSRASALSSEEMQLYITSAQSQLIKLEQQGSKACIQGQLSIAQSYLTRASAEHNAGMKNDAFISLIDFDRQIRKIYCINSYIKGQLGCQFTNQKTVLKRWYDEGEYQQCNTELASSFTNKQKHQLITETLYEFDQDQIKPIYYQSLSKLADLVKSYPKSTLMISGHTDTLGSSQYNIELSKRRAQSIVSYFNDKGVNASQIVMKANGEKDIREQEQSDESRAFNRYTSITLMLDTSM